MESTITQASSAEMSAAQSSRAETSQTTPAKGKAHLKRKADSLKDDKKKKRKPVKRTVRPNYTVQEGEDMLLIISNISSGDSVWKPKRKVCKKKKTNKKAKTKGSIGKTKKAPVKTKVLKLREETDNKNVVMDSAKTDSFDHWGQSLPLEILVKIFQFAVFQDGAVPLLCRY